MGQNPYPVEIAEAGGGPVKTAGDLTFTDPGNQPGGSSPGVARVLGPFPFAFNTAGLTTGHTIYTPTINDILLDAWIEVDTAFDGTTPKADVGQFDGITYGFWGATAVGGYDLTVTDGTDQTGLLTGDQGGAVSGVELGASHSAPTIAIRLFPAKFLTALPVQLVVSQDGSKGGAATGATVGDGCVYLVVATPSLT